jgi:hypothetical protein
VVIGRVGSGSGSGSGQTDRVNLTYLKKSSWAGLGQGQSGRVNLYVVFFQIFDIF